ncbi:MAG: YwmB family TATA-box binding protein [Firmicutes bacterium]|nr:YwmB family TATA-box binding protein [Bacillota bacterium]
MIRTLHKIDFLILGLSAVALAAAIGYGIWYGTEKNIAPTTAPSELTLSTAFAESGAELVQVSARCWEQVDNTFHSGKEMALYCAAIAQVLGDDDLLTFDEYDDQGIAGFSIGGTTEQGYELNLVFQSLGDRNTEDETYLVAEVCDKSGKDHAEELQAYVREIFAAVNCRCDPYLMMEGKYEEILSKREKKRVSKNIFALMDGTIEEKISDGSYISFSGYTPNLSGSIQSDDHTINLQTALSDNDVDGSTHIYLGTPVVFSDF